jgi:hypothetical protein
LKHPWMPGLGRIWRIVIADQAKTARKPRSEALTERTDSESGWLGIWEKVSTVCTREKTRLLTEGSWTDPS